VVEQPTAGSLGTQPRPFICWDWVPRIPSLPNLLLDANIGYTRQHISATDVDITEDKEFGLNTLKIPGTNDAGLASNQLYWGIPEFEFGTAYSALGNSHRFESVYLPRQSDIGECEPDVGEEQTSIPFWI